MEVEKRGVKGGFFQMFDWNSKSRKKLFSGKSELPESSHQGKESFYSSGFTQNQQGLENGFALRASDHNYASSASGDSEYGTKPPGVVARLMGLDSLPNATSGETNVAPFDDFHSFRDSAYIRPPSTIRSEQDAVIFDSVRNKLDGLSRNLLEPRPQNRPIERFQSEVLPPPKSAKSTIIPHNRHLSPIKSPGFIPPKNAAYLFEAAAKITEQSPRSTIKGKLPSIGSSSLPSRFQDMKEKMEASQRSSSSVKSVKKQVLSKGSEEPKRVSSHRSRNKDKSVSLGIDSKVNIQRRDGSTSVGYRTSDKQNDHSGTKPSRMSRNIPHNKEKKMEKQSVPKKPSEVLKPNSQKQNCAPVKDRDNAESSFSHVKDRKEPNGRTNRTVNRIVLDSAVSSRKIDLLAADLGRELSTSKTKMIPKKKLPISGNIQRKPLQTKDEKSITCNIAFEGDSRWDATDSKKSSLDVISFTFTSPIKKSGAGSNSFDNVSGSSFTDHDPSGCESELRSSAASSSGFNNDSGVGDSLSVLLEQKLKELTSRVESSQQDMSKASSVSTSGYSYRNMDSTAHLVNSLSMNNGDMGKGEHERCSSDYSSIEKLLHEAEKAYKELENIEKGDGLVDYQGRYFHSQNSGSAFCLPSLSESTSYSFDVDRSPSNEDSMQGLSFESYEATGWSSTRKYQSPEIDVEISDTASSFSVATISEMVESNLYIIDSNNSSYWELQYILEILNSGPLMFEDFTLNKSHYIVSPEIFHQLENKKIHTEERFLHERKVLFDSVCECLEARCERLVAEGYSLWSKGLNLLNKKQWLAEELYREISGWTNDEELMVDEVVEKDMSRKNGKWVDFELEAFEEGVDIEAQIMSLLVDELIDDFLPPLKVRKYRAFDQEAVKRLIEISNFS